MCIYIHIFSVKPSNAHTNTFHASNPAIEPYMTQKSSCSRFYVGGGRDFAVSFIGLVMVRLG